MRVFLDTTVWLSSFIASGVCHEVLERCLTEHQILTSSWVIGEIEENLRNKFKFQAPHILEIVSFVRNRSELVTEVSSLRACRDPDDNHILAGARDGQADCIITGDKELLEIKRFEKIAVLKPGEFLKMEADPII